MPLSDTVPVAYRSRWLLKVIHAGFPSPAAHYIEGTLSLDGLLIKHPSATFFVKVADDSMLGCGIHQGDRGTVV